MPFINTEKFNNFLLFFIALIFFRFVFEYINKYYIAIIGEKFTKKLREQLFKHQLQVDTSIYDQKGIGKYLLRYSGDLKSIQNYVTKGLFRFSQDLFLILFLLITISYINLNLGAIIAFSIGIAIITLFFINRTLYSISVNRRNQRSAMLAFVNTRLRAMLTIKAFNRYTPEEKRYTKRSKNLYAVGKEYQQTLNFINAIIPMLTYLMLAFLMWYVYFLKTDNTHISNESVLLILILLIISFLPILRRSLRVSIIWKLGDISFNKLLQIFYLEVENSLPFEKKDFANTEISIKNVVIKYPHTEAFIFDKLNISILPKKITAIIGGSGSGKDTLIKLLLKIYLPNEGDIYFGEYSHKELSEKTIRKNISVISNSFPLYGRTVYEAITYSRNKDKKIKASKILKNLQKFETRNNRLELEDTIGDLGATLTSGQKKILLYCRALLTNKPWLIIDSPFKDVNVKTATHLKNILNKLKERKTLIIIDNKIPEGLNADYIYTIKKRSATVVQK
ncbi:MAG: ABC transporter ATP-binding protein [Flavobacteriales bacterium]|nr:ABC transporter ATP-binding protein [Flavobacteriales bacterium]